MSPVDQQVQPAGEEIHLPGPSLQPVGLAFGITLAIVGVTLGAALWVPGVIITLLVLFRWVRDARTELAELPLEHRH